MGRFIVLNTIGFGILLAAYLTGYLPQLLTHDHLHVMPIMALIALYGLYRGAVGDWARLLWVADRMPLVGLIATGTAIQFVTGQGEQLMTNMRYALVGMISGVAWLLWLEFVEWCCNAEK